MVRPDPADQELAVSTIPALLAQSARSRGAQPALWRWTGDRFEAVSYAALTGAVATIADRLRARGVGSDDRVPVWVNDRFTWGVAYLAVLWTGATVVPIDPLLELSTIASVVDDAQARFVLTDRSEATGLFDSAVQVIPLEEVWSEFDTVPAGAFPEPPSIDPQRPAAILYTSGTTGAAKGVMLSHANITSDLNAISRLRMVRSDDVFLSVLPIHHAFECTVGFLFPLSIGAQVVYARSLKSNEIIADLRSMKATLLLGVPLLFEKMAASIRRKVRETSPGRRRLFALLSWLSRRARMFGWRRAGRLLFASIRDRGGIGSLRLVFSGGAALPADVGEFFDTIGLPLLQGYGLSETSPLVTVNRPGTYRYDTVGLPVPGIDVSLHEPRPDGTGEIAVRGPIVMQGYWRRPAESAEVLKDGRLLTGDLGTIDPDGHLRILGRLKNVIISGAGKNIYPEEIETLLDAQPEIAESLVYGKTRPGRIGETVAAFVVPDGEWFETAWPGVLDDTEHLRTALGEAIQRVCAQFAQYKRITEWEMRRDPFERTSTRKIKRHLVVPDARVPGR